MKLFINNGAKLDTPTRSGMTAMHLAAKSDNILMLAWLRNKNRKEEAEALDKQNLTPLHYAAMLSCELATAVLLSWKVDVNIPNKKDQTPLHLAVTSGSQRIIRSLLIRGAKVDLKDYEGKTPLDLAFEKGNPDIISLIKSPGIQSICGIKPPQRPIKFKPLLMSIYIFLLIAGNVAIFFYLKPPLDDFMLSQESEDLKSTLGTNNSTYSNSTTLQSTNSTNSTDITNSTETINPNITEGMSKQISATFLVYEWLCLLEIIFFTLIVLRNPGYLKKNHEHMLLDLATNYECFQICPECVTKRPPRSRHCQCCNKCVEKFDHHCPWINNCIGARNLGIFYCFLVITFAYIVDAAYVCILYMFEIRLDSGILEFSLAAAFAFVSIGFLIPLFLLISVQTRNFWTNTTTNERYSRRTEANVVERSDSDDQVDRSKVCGNIWEMCCNTQKQEYKMRTIAPSEPVTRYTQIADDFKLNHPLLGNNSDQ